jgi:8-oxo-dGTP diphosphatase
MRVSRIFVTVDIVVARKEKQGFSILLIQRRNDPFKGDWALPGGFVDENEDLPDAARRELREETGLEISNLEQLGAFGKPGRDPRHHTVSVAFLAHAGQKSVAVAADDAQDAKWFALDDLPALAFDHDQIVAQGKLRLLP